MTNVKIHRMKNVLWAACQMMPRTFKYNRQFVFELIQFTAVVEPLTNNTRGILKIVREWWLRTVRVFWRISSANLYEEKVKDIMNMYIQVR